METYMGKVFTEATVRIAVHKKRLAQGRTRLLWRCHINGGGVLPLESLCLTGTACPENVGQGVNPNADQGQDEFLGWMWFFGDAVISADHVLSLTVHEPSSQKTVEVEVPDPTFRRATVHVALNKPRILQGEKTLLWCCRITDGPLILLEQCVVLGSFLPGNHGLGVNRKARREEGEFPAWVWFYGDVSIGADYADHVVRIRLQDPR